MYFVTAKSMFTMGAGLIVVLGALAFTFIRLELKKKKNLKKKASQSAQAYLSYALAERSIIEVTLDDPATNPDIHDSRCPSFVGTCVEIKPGAAVLSVSPRAIDNSWLKVAVHVFFQIKKDPSHRFCNFQSCILDIVPQQSDNLVFLQLPDTISHEQRRLFVRLRPNPQNMEPIDMWRGVQPPDSENMLWSPFSRESFKLVDISVGGAKFEFKESVSTWKNMVPGTTILMKLILPPLSNYQPEQQIFLIESKCVRVVQPKPSQAGHVGLGFNRWLAHDPRQKTKNWHTVDKELGMQPLGAWILQKQLEQHHAAKKEEVVEKNSPPAAIKL